MLKRTIAIVICAMMVLLTMVGCSNDDADTNSKSGDSTVASGENGKEELTILIPTMSGVQDMKTNGFTKWIEEQTNVHVTWQSIPPEGQGGEEKLALLLTGGDLPDVFMNCPITPQMVSKYGVDEKVFIPLDEYMGGDLTPNMNKVWKDLEPKGITPDVIRQMDGKIYSMPRFDDCQHCEHYQKMWYYEPWLKELGAEVPTTTDELYDLLVKIRDTDLNKNGKKDEIPMMGAEVSWGGKADDFLMNAFISYNYDTQGLYLDDGTIKGANDQEDFREGLRYLNKLYKEGLLYEGTLTQDSATQVKITETPDYPMVGFNFGGYVGIFATLGSERGSAFRPALPLKGPKGFKDVPQTVQVPSAHGYFISDACKNPEVAIKYADFMYSTESTLSVRGGGGIEGVGWAKADEGQIGLDGNPAIWKILKPWNDSAPQNDTWLAYGVWNQTPLRISQAIDDDLDMWSTEGNEWALYDMTEKYYAPNSLKRGLPPLNYSVEEGEELATIVTELDTCIDSARFDFVSGSRDLDKDWDKYVKELHNAGYPRLIEIRQAAYDRQYK